MKTSEVLKRAKRYLSKGSADNKKTSFICWAIGRAVNANQVSAYDCTCVQDMIQARLGPCSTLEHWLFTNYGIECERPETYAFQNKVQATRHAWVDSMIAEFAARGD